MTFPRSSGILLHPTSLPSAFGIGDLGPEAYRFASFLEKSGQTLWQVLPLGPTGYGDSPYACYSAFAGNTLLISPDLLIEDGLLVKEDLADYPSLPAHQVEFSDVHKFKAALLHKAFNRFKQGAKPKLTEDFNDFSEQQAWWLEDYSLFQALKDAHGGAAWYEWEPQLIHREPSPMTSVRSIFREQIQAQKLYQFLFFRQWHRLKSYCNERGIKMIGDLPIFVAHDSADVWTNPDQFKLDKNGSPLVVAGVPPDYFSATGQLWGNPLYNWERMIEDGFEWWLKRVKATLSVVDIVRVDHFRGFAASWEIPGGDKTAERGRWIEAPGRELFSTIREKLGELPIIAEDLGVITPDVVALRDDFGFPGMRILQFAFGGDTTNIDLPHNFVPNVVAYTGTHDNDTTVGWFRGVAGEGSTRTAEQIENERKFCLEYLNSKGDEIHWDFIRAVLASVANTAVIPLQDLLGLGTEGRMNLPNSTEGNWMWRFKAEALDDALAERLRQLTELYGRTSVKAREETDVAQETKKLSTKTH